MGRLRGPVTEKTNLPIAVNKYLKALRGLCWSVLTHGLRERSLGELEYAACVADAAVAKIPSTLLRSIPAIWSDRIMGQPENLILRIGKHEDGSLPVEDLVVLVYLLLRERPASVLEIGTYMGHTTRAIAENCPETIVHTLDLPPDFDRQSDTVEIPKDDHHLIERRKVGREFAGKPCGERIRQHFGDSATWDYNQARGATFFFIDGAHTYEYVKNDTEKCFELSGRRGIFLWHDVDDRHPGVVRYLAELRQSGVDVVRFANTQLAYFKGA